MHFQLSLSPPTLTEPARSKGTAPYEQILEVLEVYTSHSNAKYTFAYLNIVYGSLLP